MKNWDHKTFKKDMLIGFKPGNIVIYVARTELEAARWILSGRWQVLRWEGEDGIRNGEWYNAITNTPWDT